MSLYDRKEPLPQRAPSPETMADIINMDDHRLPELKPASERTFDEKLDEMFSEIKDKHPDRPLYALPSFEEIDREFSKISGRGTASEEAIAAMRPSVFSRDGDGSKSQDSRFVGHTEERLSEILDSVQGMLENPETVSEPEVLDVDTIEFTVPKKTDRMRNWIQQKSVQVSNAVSRVFEKAKEHPVTAVAVVVGSLAVTAYASYKFGVSKGSSNANEVANSLGSSIKPPSSTNSLDRATEWYELYRQNNAGVSREQFNQIITSEEFSAMCKNPEQFARLVAATS